MTGTEICPKCGTHFDGVWWRNAETENKQLKQQLEVERERHGDEMTSVQLQLNKQLAAEREKLEWEKQEHAKLWEQCEQLRNQLAAAVEALEKIREDYRNNTWPTADITKSIDAALARLVEGKE